MKNNTIKFGLTWLLILTVICDSALAEPATSLAIALETKGAQIHRDKTTKQIIEIWAWGGVKLTEQDFQEISQQPALKKLFFQQGDRKLDDQMIKVLGTMPAVEFLFTDMALLSDEGMQTLATWKELSSLSLIHWGWAKGWRGFPDPKTMPGKELVHLTKLPKLTKLNLGGARIDDSALKVVSQIKQLEELKLFHAVAVSDAGVPELAPLTKLQLIEFGSVRITDHSLAHLSKMPSLVEIHLAETWLTYENGLKHLQSLPNLKRLKLKDVVVATGDLAKLQAELPALAVEWKAPDEKMLAKMTAEKKKLDSALQKLERK